MSHHNLSSRFRVPASMTAIPLLLAVLLGCGESSPPMPTATTANLAFPTPKADIRREAITGRSLLIEDALLIDGRGGPPQPDVDVLVLNGKIAAIDDDLKPDPPVPTIDARGLTLLPGLIASHAHVQSVPGSVIRQDSADAIAAQQALQLRAMLASGYTTVLDPAIGAETAARLRGRLAQGEPGPELLVLAPFLTPARGYMTSPEMRGPAFADFWPGIHAQTDLTALIQEAASLEPRGIKVAIEDGVLFPNLPVFDDETFANIQALSPEHRLFVHSISNKDHARALELNPYALVHIGMWDETIDPEIVETLKQRGTWVMSTTTLHHLAAWGWTQTFAQDPWIRARVPIVQWETAIHPDEPSHLNRLTSEMMRPWWIPGWLARAGAPLFTPSTASAAKATASSVAAIKALDDAGIPWVVGADEGNSPAYTTFFHGVSSQIELEQLELGGLPRASILAASTERPARMLGIDDRIGTIEVGKEADLLLAHRDPLQHGMVALRDLAWVIRDGEARSPAAWLVDP